MNRRDSLLALLAFGTAGKVFVLHAQTAKPVRIGFLATTRQPTFGPDGPLQRGLRELGYVEGKNLTIEARFASGRYENLPSLAAELVNLNVDVIVASGSSAINAARNAATAIPIVMTFVTDPVASGFVKSLAHPGGSITGLSSLASDIGPKRLDLILATAPKLSRVAMLVSPASPGAKPQWTGIQEAAQKAHAIVLLFEARTPQEIESAFSIMVREQVGAVIVSSSSLFIQHQEKIVDLLIKHRLPSIFGSPRSTEAGGLMSYSEDPQASLHRAATYVDKILKGAKPGDLPVEQPTKFELIINVKTAKTLGLTIPQSILLRADRVIE